MHKTPARMSWPIANSVISGKRCAGALRLVLGICGALCLPGCAYLGTMASQARYALTPASQRVYKHMLTRDTFYVFGVLRTDLQSNGRAVAVIAVSDRFSPDEVVDVSNGCEFNTYYGLNLPEGEYRLLVACDINGDGQYTAGEVVGSRSLSVHPENADDRVKGGVDIELGGKGQAAAPPALRVAARVASAPAESCFFPKGTLRTLDDPIFSPEMAELGLYQPAAFLERAPMMFYALDEQVGYRIPVIFVHGIGGSAREFASIIEKIDRTKYQVWFFHYASGTDLGQLSAMFHRIFLSGKVIPQDQVPVVIVAHSMGGLVVRDALNRMTGRPGENTVARLITIASPLGGHPAASRSKNAPVVIPSWRDLDPDSRFIRQLHSRALPGTLRYHLFYTFGDDRSVRLGEASDGVVPLSSQLTPAAQREATVQFGFNATHQGVLRDPALIQRVVDVIAEVKAPFPEDHMRELFRGGYSLPLGKQYTAREAYFIRELGRYMDALVAGRIAPIHPAQEHFVKACRGEVPATEEVERAWAKMNRDLPDR